MILSVATNAAELNFIFSFRRLALFEISCLPALRRMSATTVELRGFAALICMENERLAIGMGYSFLEWFVLERSVSFPVNGCTP